MTLDVFLSNVRKTVLPNGLTLLTREHKRGGVVAINTWVKAGYFHEPDEVAGMAHLFEHMFFKGSKNFPGAEDIARHVSSLGGSTNAGTIYDSTNYYFVMPKEGLLRGIAIQADAILNPLFDAEELRKEAEVVIEESNRKLDNPPAVAAERMFATAFREHRMKRWRIGSNEVLRNINRDHLLAFFETLYRPTNIIVTVVGDIVHQEVIDAVTETFGKLPVGELKKERGPVEPKQNEFRYAQSTSDITQCYSVFGWHTTGEGHPDEEALDLLGTTLGSGRYSRFFRGVVGPEAANSASASNNVFEDIGIFTVRASYEPGIGDEVERRVLKEIERMKRFGPLEYELELARNSVEAGFVFELEDVLGQAQTLCHFESRGRYTDMARHLEKLRAVTAEDVKRVANQYLTSSNLTLYRYLPNGSPEGEPAEILSAVDAAMAEEVEAHEQIPAPAVAVQLPAGTITDSMQQFVLTNGMTVFVRETPGTPTVSASIYFKGGRIHEKRANAGITQLMARSMRRGTTARTRDQIDREIEFLGSQISIAIDEDFFGFGIDILPKYFVAGTEILADVMLHPTFPEDGLGEERHLQLASIRRSLDSSGERPFQLFFDSFYGDHPYGYPDAGYTESIAAVTRDEVESWYRREVTADSAMAVVVGDVMADSVRELFEQHFGSLPKSVTLHEPVPAPVPPSQSSEVVEVRDRKQTALVIGFPSVTPQHDDWTLLRVLQDITSGLAGTLFAELRGKRSLAYTVYAGDSAHQLAGAFVAFIASDASKENDAREGLLSEIKRLAIDGFGEEELARAKSYIAGSMRLRLQTNSALASEITQHSLYGLGLDFTARFLERVKAVTLEEVRGVAAKYLSGDNYTIAILRGKMVSIND